MSEQDIPLQAPGIAFPGAVARPESAYRTAHDLLVEDDPSDAWAQHALGRALERQSRHREALPHLRLAAAMSGDVEHELAVLRVERLAGELDK